MTSAWADEDWTGGSGGGSPDTGGAIMIDGSGEMASGLGAQPGLILGGGGMFLMPNYQVSSAPGSFSATAPGNSGFGWSAMARIGYAQGRAFHLEYQTFSKVFDVPSSTGLSPATSEVIRQSATIRHDWDLNERWKIGIGIMGRHRSAGLTTPRLLFARHVAHGLSAFVGYERPVGRFRMWSEVEFRLPVFFREFGQSTGDRTFLGEGRAQLGTKFYLGTSKDFGVSFELRASVRYDYELNRFEGTGSRGTSNATETFSFFSVPVELRILF
ncbi:MAG: hypothetical protein JNL01_09790 [Bdellovibrionales bacterium]|nr:hypothetical protein [Bdellovibrionales bacterium]